MDKILPSVVHRSCKFLIIKTVGYYGLWITTNNSLSDKTKTFKKNYLLTQYERASLNNSELGYIPRCSKPTIFSLHALYGFIIPSEYVIPAKRNTVSAILITVDITSMDDVVDRSCFDFVIRSVLVIGVSNRILILTPPLIFYFWSYLVYD